MFALRSDRLSVSYRTAVAIVIFEFIASSLYLPYGILYSQLVALHVTNNRNGLWTPVIFIAILNMSRPWGRNICEQLDDSDEDYHRQNITIASFALVASIMLTSWFPSMILHTIAYGVAGGIFSSLCTNQIKVTTYDDFQSEPGLFRLLQHVGRAICLFVMPHILVFLIKTYGVFNAQLLIAGIVLQAIPVSMMIKKKTFITNKLRRFETLSGLSNGALSDLPPNETSVRELETHSYTEIPTEPETSTETTQTVTEEDVAIPVMSQKTPLGIDVLPGIPEEEEEEEPDEIQPTKVDVNRLSRLSTQFEDLIKVDALEQSQNSQTSLKHHISLSNITNKRRTLVHCPRFSSYHKYVLRKRFEHVLEFVCDNFLQPLYNSLLLCRFYPCLFTKVVETLTAVTFLTLMPYFSARNDSVLQHAVSEPALMLTVVSFSWLCFLVFSPWMLNCNSRTGSVIFVVGITLVAVSNSLLFNIINEDLLTLSCLIFGLGFGLLSFSNNMFYKRQIGARHWRTVEGPLEVLTGIFVILIYYVICESRLDIFLMLPASTFIYIPVILFWLVIILIKFMPI